MSRTLPVGDMMRNRFFQGTVAGLVAAVVVLVAAIAGAVHLQPVSVAAPPPAVPDSALRFAAAGDRANVAAAVARDLFTDDRRAPAKRYLLPGEQEAAARGPAPQPVVLGTAIGSGDDFAICQAPGGQPAIARVGQRVGGFTVVSIERTRVVFRGPDGERLSIDASKP